MSENEMKTKPPNRLAGDQGFKGKTLLITGCTGFVGKVLLEKILRSCPLVNRIYVIVREKREKHPQTRLKEMFDGPLYDLVKKTRGEKILEKVIAIPGDVAEVNLGMSKENWNLLAEEVEMIFHLAATIRFDDPLKKSILLNSRGTKLLLNLAKECKKLLVFAYVSTAYCHPHQKVLHEQMYAPPANPDDIVALAELIDEDLVDMIANKLKGNSPNTYTYTKALAEGFVNNEMNNLPVIILRPSVGRLNFVSIDNDVLTETNVVPIWLEPIPGWTDNLNGPAGLLVAAGKGVCRSMYCNSSTYADFVPVDIVANLIMLATYDYMVHKKRRVFNLTTSSRVKLTWGEIIDLGKRLTTTKIPLNWVVWYPGGGLNSSRWIHNISVLLFHYIPAIFLDSIIILSGNKPVLWKVQRKLSKGFELFEYYTNNQWDFVDNNILKLKELANETESEIYKANEEGFHTETYFLNCIHAVRLYLLKESDESLPTARRHMKVMWAIDRICKLLILFAFGRLVMKYFVYPVLNKEY